MRKVDVGRRAEDDMFRILVYLINEAGTEVAKRFHANCQLGFAHLLQFPGTGEPVLTARPRLKGLRRLRVDDFERYQIFYLERSWGIKIVHVRHSSQDWWKQFKVKGK